MDTAAILQIASKIMADLGAGYSESIYQNAMHRKLAREDGTCIMEKKIPVVYEGDTLGVCRADIVTDTHVIEIKCARRMPTGVEKQVCKYTKHLLELDGKARAGVVINFNQETEEIETLVFPAPLPSTSVECTQKRRKFTPVDDLND
jgi:GxxExxY protein